jgi:hypothetical protein
MRAIEITADQASNLRGLFRRSVETYAAFENLENTLKKGISEIVGTIHSGEVAVLSKTNHRIDVVSHKEYLDDTAKIRWH